MMIERTHYIDDLTNFAGKKLIKVVTGIRRAGKSTLFQLFIEKLKKQGIPESNIVLVNMEHPDFRKIKTADDLYEHIEHRLSSSGCNYVFIDEIQQISDFQKATDWLYARNDVDLYITGSNAYLLSGELATLLSGRYVEIRMQPLSFKEYVSNFPEERDRDRLFSSYLENSSFPGILELSRKKDRYAYLEGIYNTILVKDIMDRSKISNPTMLKSVIEFMFDNIGNLVSSTKIANTMQSAGRKISVPTIESYLSALENSFVLYRSGRYDIKGKQRLATGYKYYVADIGLRYFLLGSSQNDLGHILENIVYLELIRRRYEVYIGKNNETEVDFVAIHENGTKEYYQVSLSVLEETTLKRELRPLQQIYDHYPKILLTMDKLPITSYDGIIRKNVIDWLLDDGREQADR